ncbi:MAG: hypothetical protein LBE54_10395 [Brucellaceae bacterium]|jgi:hypothetical protein|nr:hypothetical protein [Brucellaceae bacterium]
MQYSGLEQGAGKTTGSSDKDELPAILPAEPVQYSSISGFYDVFVKALLHNFVFALKRINNAVFYKFRVFRPLKSRTLFPEVL